MSAETAQEADERVVAKTLREANVGEFVLYRQSRGGQWIEVEVADVNPQSVVIIKTEMRPAREWGLVKICRTPDKPNTPLSQLKFGHARGRSWGMALGADEVGKFTHEENERFWADAHRHKISDRVRWLSDAATLRKVAALIGYHDTAAKDCKQ